MANNFRFSNRSTTPTDPEPPKKGRFSLSGLIIALVTLVIAFIFFGHVFGNDNTADVTQLNNSNTTAAFSETVNQTEAQAQANTTQVLYEDDLVRVNYYSAGKFPEYENGVIIRLGVVNKTGGKMSATMQDFYVNDFMLSAAPIFGGVGDIEPGREGASTMMFSYHLANCASYEDIHNVKFKYMLFNPDTYEDIETTPEITIPIAIPNQ